MCAQYDRKDALYARAKEEGWRSRAAFKLQELNKKNKFIRAGSKVLDLGNWPGGWTQVAAQLVGEAGVVVGIDLVAVNEFPDKNVVLITGDARDESVLAQAAVHAPAGYDAVISDMSPKLTGIAECDQAGTVACAELALYVASQVLKSDGVLVIKVFKGNDTEQFIRSIRGSFQKVSRVELEATRKTSNEFYIVAVVFKKTGVAPSA